MQDNVLVGRCLASRDELVCDRWCSQCDHVTLCIDLDSTVDHIPGSLCSPTVTSATEGTTTFDGRCSSYARSYPFEWTIPTGHINSQRLDSLLELELGPVHNAPPEACGLG